MRKILFKFIKPLPANDYLGSSWPTYKATEKLVAPILAIAEKFGATGHLWTLGHYLLGAYCPDSICLYFCSLVCTLHWLQAPQRASANPECNGNYDWQVAMCSYWCRQETCSSRWLQQETVRTYAPTGGNSTSRVGRGAGALGAWGSKKQCSGWGWGRCKI